MPRIEMDDFLSDYERAVCYFTLPKLVYHINPLYLFIYFVLIILSFFVTFWGIMLGNQQLAYLGTFALILIAILGFLFFTGRSLINELRWRKCLAEAHGSPSQETLDLPDPFENHELFIIPLKEKDSVLFPCVNREGEILYFVEEKKQGWLVKDPQEKEVCIIFMKRSWFSFSFTNKPPKIILVIKDNKKIASIKPKFSFWGPASALTLFENQKENYWILHSGIFYRGELVGRIYQLRRCVYLDVKKEHFNLGLLAFFIASIK